MLTDDVSNKFWCSDFCRELLARADLLIYICLAGRLPMTPQILVKGL